jgi:shikimate kinase/3-dehydroquinate synthase
MSNEKRHIFLIGPSGVGKTTTAMAVGSLLDREVVDLDDYIANQVQMPISEYFKKHGEPAFRDVERQAIQDLCYEAEPKVFATGGGSVLDSRNIVNMRNHGYVMYLSAFEADIVERIANDSSNARPLLAGDVENKIHEQFLSRRESYELAAEITIATSRRDVEAVAQAVVRQFMRASGQNVEGASTIKVGDHLFADFADLIPHYPTVVLVSQSNIPRKYIEEITQSLTKSGTRVVPCEIENSEDAKSFDSYRDVIETMARERVTRSSAVIAVGGGVVGDLSGFVASTYHRGVDVIQVPTTLLAQVDSSIGGKCGINLSTGKNLVGAFHQPRCIVADTTTLETLPDNDFRSGLGEVAKYALLGNTVVSELILESAPEILKREHDVLVPLIRSCMNHKLQIVARDPHERNGIRATLNLGHTLAHAIETTTLYRLAHGAAVALGLRFASELSVALGRIPQLQCDESIALIDALGLESDMPESCRDAEKLVELMYSDKKSEGGLSLVLMNIGGGAELVHDVDKEVVTQTLERFISR